MPGRGVPSLEQSLDGWANAERHGNTSFLERTRTDDFVGSGPHRFISTKAGWHRRYQSGERKHVSFH